MPCRLRGVPFAPIPERGCKIYFSLCCVLCCAGEIVVYICSVFQRWGTVKHTR